MNKKLFTLIITLLTFQNVWALSDREQVNQTMECFFKWDIEGGAEVAKSCIYAKVNYHSVNGSGEYVVRNPNLDFKGKGKETLEFNITNVDIYNDMAVVNALIRYNPQSAQNTYMKTYLLYKLKEGWRVTDVAWGRVTNNQ